MARQLSAVLVDCDNTVYPPETGLLSAGDRRIAEFIARRLDLPFADADALRARLWRGYGTTARGLAVEYGIAPEEMCREALESLDFRALLAPDPALAAQLAAVGLPLYVFTNSTEVYARRVLEALGLAHVFTGIFAIGFLGWEGKPNPVAYARVEEALGLAPTELALADDNPGNLRVARELGWFAVAVGEEAAGAGDAEIATLHDLAGALEAAGRL